MKRGEIWWAELGEPHGSAPGYRRPILIVQADSFNRSLIRSVIVIALTTNLDLSEAPGNVPISVQQSRLPKDSVANVSQILTLEKRYLSEYVSTVRGKTMQRIEAGLKLALELH